MSLLKAEAAKLANDVLRQGIIETIVKESAVLQMMPFDTLVGTALTYNREKTLPSASFFDPLDTWTESTPTFDQFSAPLKILGGDADIDNFLQNSYANANDLSAVVLQSRLKAIAHLFSDSFFNGDSGLNPKSFDGLTKILTGTTQELAVGVNGGPLTLDLMDQMIDLVVPGKPDGLFVSRRTRRKLSSLRRASGNLLETGVDDFGRRALFYDGIPLFVDDFISDAQVQGSSGGVCSSIYAVKFGQEGMQGYQNDLPNAQLVGDLETKDAKRWRTKWYATCVNLSALGIARLKGITAA